MADRLPLRIVYVNGVPTIGEFQDGDTLGVEHGGTGTSSLAGLKDSLGWTLSSLYDVNIDYPGTIDNLSYGDVLTWNGSFWTNNHVPHMEYADYSGAPYDISSISFLTNLGSITLQEGEIAWDGTASTIQVQTDASTTQLAVLQVSSASNDGDILLWDGTNGYYYPTSAFVDVSSQVDVNTSALENTLDASDLSVELSAISTELSAISIELSSIVSSIHLSGLGDVSFTDLSADQHLNWDGTNWVNADNDRTEMRVRNGTASPMSRGDAIAIESAHNQNLVNVILADASQTSAMPALGILKDDLAVGAEGIAITFGKAGGLNTSGLTEGATAYVSPFTPGTITETKPTDTSHLIQNIGIIMRAHQSNGAIKVTGIGRANDIDNVTRDKIQYVNGYTVMPQINSSYSGLTEWVEGSGSMTNDWIIYTTTMNASSNERVYAPDPFNGSSIVWKAYDDGPGDGSPFEGGFKNKLTLTGLDISKDHRLSVFIKQHDNQDGVLYFGPEQWNTTSNALFRQNTGAFDTDPYFETYANNPKVDEWYLWVGYINASGTPSGTDNYSDLYGIYNMSGVRVESNFNEYTFSSTNCTTTNIRAFYFADAVNDGAVGASFWHPRIDALDGNEPSIRDLLKLYTTQHGQLDGLDQNDHPQYALSSTLYDTSAKLLKETNEFVKQKCLPWEEGSNDYVSEGGTWTDLANTTTTREYLDDPFRGKAILWDTSSTGGGGGGRCGYQSPEVEVDVTKTYRIVDFFKVEEINNSPNEASHLFRTFQYDSSGASINTTTHRFAYPLGLNKWYMIVSFLRQADASGVSTNREDTGIWDLTAVQKVSDSVTDGTLDPSTVTVKLWSSLYNHYEASSTIRLLQFPSRIDECNEHMPSVYELMRSSVLEHGSLNGLLDDDHPQYRETTCQLRVNGFFPWLEGSGSFTAEKGGTWSIAGDASSFERRLEPDPYGGSSVVFDISGGGTLQAVYNQDQPVRVYDDRSYRISMIINADYDFATANIAHGFYLYNDSLVRVAAVTTGGTVSTNNYWYYVLDPPSRNKWYMIVQHINAYDYTASGSNRPETGVWDLESGVQVNTDGTDWNFIQGNEASILHLRDWITGASSSDHWKILDYRVDEINEHTPTIQDLLIKARKTALEVPSISEGGSSVTGLGRLPIPAPFWYGQTTTDAAASRSYDWGSAATETEVVCDDHFNWDSANSRLYVSSTGIYEVDVMFMIDGGSDFTAEVIVKVDGTGKNTTTHDYVSANSPSEYSGRWVGKIEAGSYVTATFRDAAVVVSTSHEAGSTMIVKRLA